MNTDQARRIVTLHDNADRALANLRNANSMATDDPRAPELLEEAGDAYAEATTALFAEQLRLRTAAVGESVALTADHPTGFEPGKAAWIVNDGIGAGIILPPVKGIAEGNIALRLTTDALFRDESYADGTTISVPTDCLSLEAPADAPSASETGAEDSGEGQGTPSA